MPPVDYLIGPARGEIRWHPAVDGQPPMDLPHVSPVRGPGAPPLSAWPRPPASRRSPRHCPRATCAASSKPGLPALSTASSTTGAAPKTVARAGSATLGDRDRRTTRSDGEPHPAGFLRDELLRIAGLALLWPFERRQDVAVSGRGPFASAQRATGAGSEPPNGAADTGIREGEPGWWRSLGTARCDARICRDVHHGRLLCDSGDHPSLPLRRHHSDPREAGGLITTETGHP